MSNNSFRIKNSAVLVPASSPTLSDQGELAFDSVTDTIKVRNSASTDTLAQIAATQTFTNKSINAATNTITNITNTEVSASAAIAYSKLALSNSIVNADINTSAAVAYSKLASMSTGQILLGNAGVATATTLSGDITVNATGITAIGAAKVTNAMLAGSIDVTTKVTGILPLANGGTNASTKAGAFDSLSPMTTLGDTIYGGASGTGTRLPIGTTNQVLTTVGGIPAWTTVNSGGINYISANPSSETDTAGWATYADAAGNIPVDGTGGTATGLTFARSTSSPLIGTASFLMTQANSTSLQGKGVSYDFTIDSAYKASVLSVQFNYNASSTFVASNGTTAPLNDGTTTTNAGNSDVEVFIYDITNAVLIPVSPQVITANGANNFVFKGTFQTASNSTSYRLIFHVATANSNATGWQFKFDGVSVGPQVSVSGSAITDWVAYTPTGAWTANTTYTGYYRRVGDTLQTWVKIALAGAPTSATLSVNLPSGLTIDTTKFDADTDNYTLGLAYAKSAGADYQSSIRYQTSTSVQPVSWSVSGARVGNAAITQAAPATFANGDEIHIEYSVPVAGWSSTSVMSNDTDTRIVSARYTVGAAQNINSSTTPSIVNYSALIEDTHSAVTTGASWKFTVPIAGDYKVNAALDWGVYTNITAASFNVFKNGSLFARLQNLASSTLASQQMGGGCKLTGLVAGDTIDVRAAQTDSGSATRAIDTASTHGFIEIERLSGPATIAASDTVACKYTGTASPTITTEAIIKYQTLDYDTHGAYSVSTGLFTAPISGKYQVTAHARFNSANWSAAQAAVLGVQFNGAAAASNAIDERYGVGATTNLEPYVMNTFNLLAGQTLAISASSDVSSSLSSSRAWLTITRVGN
jgi:hypothetical protein